MFLIGGPTKEEKPTGVRLDSGDLMSKIWFKIVMSQFSRKCYHGVPRIIQNSYKHDENEEIIELPKEWKNK